MAIAVRSVKAGVTRFGYLRSRLKDGAKLGCRGAATGPPTRTPARSACRFRCIRRTKPDAKQHQLQAYEKLHHSIFIRSVKAEMTRFAHLRSRLLHRHSLHQLHLFTTQQLLNIDQDQHALTKRSQSG
ncbi:hypothetical protein EYY89_18415 [Hafnia paralvei]|uniref:Uncharacterized protein n=1 Tax=Hafnia paralvei TaxID=546367 RepID=A0A4Q9EJ11_9GAMM|nr:hypothetical protein EYY89_18415 [Hafnia paralvei]